MAAPWFDDLTLQLDEDLDDEDQVGEPWKVNVQPENLQKDSIRCRLLVIALGDSPYLFSNKFLRKRCDGATTVARVGLSKANKDYANWESIAIKRTESVLWCSGGDDDGLAVLECRHEVFPEAANSWSEAVLGFVKADSVVVLSSFPAVRFQGVENIVDLLPMMRSLVTDTWSSALPWPVLESPNVVLGCAAAVLTQCQLLGIPAAVCSLVVGSADVDVDALVQLLQVLHIDSAQPHFKNVVSVQRADLVAELRKIVPPPSSSGSMFQ
eukprot:scpid4950/ scgid6870/ Proteasome assembly chaperone 1